jgi:peptidyl-dipeptidase A
VALGYDMSAADFEKESDRLWQQVRPLYEQLHCYVRGRLQAAYGKDRVPDGAPIPAHLLGNMWAQEWGNIWPLVEPAGTQASPGLPGPQRATLDIDKALADQQYDPVKMTRLGEAFFVSLGLESAAQDLLGALHVLQAAGPRGGLPLAAPGTPRTPTTCASRCASGRPRRTWITTPPRARARLLQLPRVLNAPGAVSSRAPTTAFHEAIGDTIALSVTPGYYQKVGLVSQAPTDEQALDQRAAQEAAGAHRLPALRQADRSVAGGRSISGPRCAQGLQRAWWKLRRDLHGFAAPVARSEADFDPGAKYHIPSQRAVHALHSWRASSISSSTARLCKARRAPGPLHTAPSTGTRGRQEAAGVCWRWALQAVAAGAGVDAGEKQMDATAIRDYFAPRRSGSPSRTSDRSAVVRKGGAGRPARRPARAIIEVDHPVSSAVSVHPTADCTCHRKLSSSASEVVDAVALVVDGEGQGEALAPWMGQLVRSQPVDPSWSKPVPVLGMGWNLFSK